MKKIYFLLIMLIWMSKADAQTLDSISPTSAYAGQQNLTITISASYVYQPDSSMWGNVFSIRLYQGSTMINIFDRYCGTFCQPIYQGLTVDSNNAYITLSIPSRTLLGVYDLELITDVPNSPQSNPRQYFLYNAFNVVAPDGYITGKVYTDENENGVYDIGEAPISSQKITIQPYFDSFTDDNGDFIFGVPNGNYTIELDTNPLNYFYLLNTDSLSFNININNTNMSGYDFGLLHGLVSAVPSTMYPGQTITSMITSRIPFQTGLNPWGNITDAKILQYGVGGSIQIPIDSFTIMDSLHVEFVWQPPGNIVLGQYWLKLKIGTKYYYLPSAFNIQLPSSYLSGKSYYDSNSNGLFDTGEPPISSSTSFFLSPDNFYAFTNTSGDFTIGASFGTHTISYISSPNLILTSQPSYTFTNSGNLSGFDFGFRSALPDFSGSISYNSDITRCSRNVNSYITYTNTSNVISQGSIYLVHSPNTTAVGALPAYSSQNGDSLFWSFSNLQPMETRTITITMANPASGIVSFLSGIDVNDVSGLQQFHSETNFSSPILCSFDPNDKTAFPIGVDDSMHFVLKSNPLEYLIRFQNTGNDTAFNVFIRDTLDVSLRTSTLEILASSHLVTTKIDSNRVATFTFDNILLPDSTIDEAGSHGFVRYKIYPNQILNDPIVVENTAFIYFDLNPPIQTNKTWNTLVSFIPVGISELTKVNGGVLFYPNPMTQTGYFNFINSNAEKFHFELFDIKGIKVESINTYGNLIELNRKKLSSGLYFYRLINIDGGTVNSGKVSIR